MDRRLRILLGLALALGVLALSVPAGASAAENPDCKGRPNADRLGGWTGYAKYCFSIVSLPAPAPAHYTHLAERALAASSRWGHRRWYCEFLHCTHGPYPYATIWGSIGMLQIVDALETGHPSRAHLAELNRVAGQFEHLFWDRARGGYAPYPYDSAGNTRTFFDDNGWIGLGFYNAYAATKNTRWLHDAARAARFVLTRGWDASTGGIWWETYHAFKSGPALASNALLATLLYNAQHEEWELQTALKYVEWGNSVDNSDERRYYRNNPDGGMTLDMVQSPMIYAQYLLCQDGQGEDYCERAGRLATTLSEQIYDANGYKYNYAPKYDAIFLQWMLAYGAATGVNYWLQLAEVNAGEAAKHAGNRAGEYLKPWWGVPFEGQKIGGLMQTDVSTGSLFAWVGVYAK